MRHLRRLGILTAATTLAGTTALAGVGAAGAQTAIPWRTDSVSSVSVERDDGGELAVSYDNQSGKDLGCYSYIGPREMVRALYDAHLEHGLVDDGMQIPPGADDEIREAIDAGQWAPGFFLSAAGESGRVTFLMSDDSSGALVPTPLEQPEDRTFSPEVLTACGDLRDDESDDLFYIELEMSIDLDGGGPGDGPGDEPGVGNGGGLFGSIADLVPALGS